MSLRIFKGVIGFVVIISMFACNYNSNVMLKADKNYPYDTIEADSSSSEYIISTSDIFEFKLYTNDGSLLVDFTAIKESQGVMTQTTTTQYLVEHDGLVKLPIIGRISLAGQSIKEVETLLEEKYSKFYIKPFVQLNVVNKRVTVFPGGGSKAQIVPLVNDNMKIIEAIGAVGGLTSLAKANRIKLIRGPLKDPKVYMFDFKTLEGLKQSDFALQANDIIYVEPRSVYYQELIRDIAPLIGLLANTITLIVVITNLSK